MRFTVIARRVAPVFLLALIAGCATPKHAVDIKTRSPTGGREVVVLIPQAEIYGDINQSTAGASMGLVGALVDYAVNQHRLSKADQAVAPLRDALNGFSFDQRAVAATEDSLAKLPWLELKDSVYSKDNSPGNLMSLLDQSQAPEVILALYEYYLDPRFVDLRVELQVTITTKAVPPGKSPGSRITPRNAIYAQSFMCVVPLANAGKDVSANIHHWAQDQGAALRQAIDQAIEHVNALVARGLQESPEDLPRIKERVKVTAGQTVWWGKLIDKDDDGTMIINWATGEWVYLAQKPVG